MDKTLLDGAASPDESVWVLWRFYREVGGSGAATEGICLRHRECGQATRPSSLGPHAYNRVPGPLLKGP